MLRTGLVLLAMVAAGCAPRGGPSAADPTRAIGTPSEAGVADVSPGAATGPANVGSAPPASQGWWTPGSSQPTGDGQWGIVRAAGSVGEERPSPRPPAAGSNRPEPPTTTAGPTPLAPGPSPRPAPGAAAVAPPASPGPSAPVAPHTGPEEAAADGSPSAVAAATHAAPPAEALGEEEIEDDVDAPGQEPAEVDSGVAPSVPPMSDAEMRQLLETSPDALGPLSVGAANGGLLVNGRRLPTSPLWDIIDPGNAWGTQETIAYLDAAVGRVHERFPNTPKMQIGHLSAKHGGPLKPHRSHQSGRDVDTSFFYQLAQPGWYRRATAANLDRAKTWAFVRALLTDTDVEYIFINTSVQLLLKEHAVAIGEDADWLDSVFQVGGKRADTIIRHAKGHDTHIHVRFFNPIAQELGRRAYPRLLALGRIKPAQYFVQHKAVKGDTLGSLARRYDTTIAAIQQANKLRGTLIMAKQVYLVPKMRASVGQPGPIRIPPRQHPPPATGARTGGTATTSASSAP